MKLKFRIFVLCITTLLLVVACERPGEQTAEEASPNSEESQVLVPVEAKIVKREAVEELIPLTGVLQPLNAVDIIAEVSGKVVTINKKAGDRVSRSDTLAVIDDRISKASFLQAKSQVLMAENNLEIATLNLKSDKELFESEDISKLAYENSVLGVKTAEANLLSAKAGLEVQEKQFEDTRLMSAISGQVSRKYVNLGTMVSPGMPVYRVVDLKVLKLEVGVPQTDIGRIRVGNPARVQIPALNDQIFEGSVYAVSPQADEETGGFMVEVHVKNTADRQILAGMTAKIDLTMREMSKIVVVPSHALVSRDGKDFVYKINEETAYLTEVKTGETIGGKVVVNQGVVSGDTIVVVGMQNLGEATPVSIEVIHP